MLNNLLDDLYILLVLEICFESIGQREAYFKCINVIICRDGDTTQERAEVAEHLSFPQVDEIREVTEDKIVVVSRIGRYYYY